MAFSVLQKQQSQAAHFLIHPPQLKSIETKGHLQVFFFGFQVCQLLVIDGNKACTLLKGTRNGSHKSFAKQF